MKISAPKPLNTPAWLQAAERRLAGEAEPPVVRSPRAIRAYGARHPLNPAPAANPPTEVQLEEEFEAVGGLRGNHASTSV